LGTARSEAAARGREPGWSMRAPMLVLAAGCVAIGLAPALFWPAIQRATAAWQPGWSPAATSPAPLQTLGAFHVAIAALAALGTLGLWRRVKNNGVTREVTWDCGYALPTPRMQYTAGSFAAIITEWFASILRPRRRASLPDSPFPASARLEVHTPETVLESVVVPIGMLVMRLSTAVRRLQHGRLQAYMLYLLAGVVALAVLALMGA
jgi:hydrogenase-4 component B